MRSRRVVVALLVAIAVGGCGDDRRVAADEIEPALRSIAGVSVETTKAPRQRLQQPVFSGRARGRGGQTLDFAVYRAQDGPGPHRFASGRTDSGVGCAGGWVFFDDGFRTDATAALATAIETAIFDTAPDASCEG